MDIKTKYDMGQKGTWWCGGDKTLNVPDKEFPAEIVGCNISVIKDADGERVLVSYGVEYYYEDGSKCRALFHEDEERSRFAPSKGGVMKLNESHLDVLRHALGYDKIDPNRDLRAGWRNRYVAGTDDLICNELERAGLLQRHRSLVLPSDEALWSVTEKGRAAVWENTPKKTLRKYKVQVVDDAGRARDGYSIMWGQSVSKVRAEAVRQLLDVDYFESFGQGLAHVQVRWLKGFTIQVPA